MILLKDLNLEPKVAEISVKLTGDVEARVRDYLPMNEKIELLQYVLDLAIDERTGCFSPVRVETYFTLGVLKWYAGIDWEGMSEVEAYDICETNGFISKVVNAIPTAEYDFMQSLLLDSVKDAQAYNTSAAGIVQAMSDNAGGLNEEMQKLLAQVKDREGLELLDDIKKVSGIE